MRNMSFMLTMQQVYDETKDVTRRLGWGFLCVGDLVMACEKCQGLKKGEKVKRIKPIRILDTRWEPLNKITPDDVVREGFPDWTPDEFIIFFCQHNSRSPDTLVNRIEYEYVK